MFILGLTGPTGAGKSRVAQLLAQNGYAILDADRTARVVVEPGSPCLEELRAAFGAQIIGPDGTLDRKMLARLAFADKENVVRLSAITHPHIMAEIRRSLRALAAEGREKAVLDAPALFEAGAEKLCDRVAVVVAPEELRFARIRSRDGMTDEEAKRRISAQQPVGFYAGRADYIVENGGSEQALETAVERLIASLEEIVMVKQQELDRGLK